LNKRGSKAFTPAGQQPIWPEPARPVEHARGVCRPQPTAGAHPVCVNKVRGNRN